ncbi:hypothetical protein PWT90_02399 [Aphanocladium album]|nr:hypothetical protein PWT90_02399 [Aphanocladium album]
MKAILEPLAREVLLSSASPRPMLVKPLQTRNRKNRSCYISERAWNVDRVDSVGKNGGMATVVLLSAEMGKDVALFAGGKPRLMLTEPDPVTIGDRAGIDGSNVVGHINSRGKFDLNRLGIGNGSVMRSGSRLLSGTKMEEGSSLL